VATSPFPVVGRCRNRPGSVSSHWAWSKTPGLPSDLQCYHIVGDITSGLDGLVAISGCLSVSQLFVDTFFESGVVENFVYHDSGCMSL